MIFFVCFSYFYFSIFKILSWSLARNSVSITRADITKQAWWFIQPKFSRSHSGSQKSKIKLSACLASPEASCFTLQMATFSCVLTGSFLCVYNPVASLCIQICFSYKDTSQIRSGPTQTASFQFNHLSGPSPQLLSHCPILGVRVFTYQLGKGDPTQSITDSFMIMFLSVNLFQFILLEVHLASWVYRFMCLMKFGQFSIMIFFECSFF